MAIFGYFQGTDEKFISGSEIVLRVVEKKIRVVFGRDVVLAVLCGTLPDEHCGAVFVEWSPGRGRDEVEWSPGRGRR